MGPSKLPYLTYGLFGPPKTGPPKKMTPAEISAPEVASTALNHSRPRNQQLRSWAWTIAAEMDLYVYTLED